MNKTNNWSNMKNTVIQGDCLIKLKELEDNSVDSIVTDPPYELGFMGKSWDNTGIANNVEMWKECLRVLKPGGHLLTFSGTRTYHRMASAIEDAGFEVRDMVEWVYGSGFPKSLNISKMLDKRRGTNEVIFAKYIKEQREKVGITKKQLNEMFGYVAGASWWEASGKQFRYPNWTDYQKLKEILSLDDRYDENLREMVGEKIGETLRGNAGFSNEQVPRPWKEKIGEEIDITAPKTDEAKKWEGWGTSLKPSHEPVICCAKPLTLELIFAKMGIDITNNLVSLCPKYNVNVKDVESSLNSIFLKLEKAGVNTVAENARTCDWENIESVVIAGMSFTSPKPISKEPPEGYKVVSAPVSANQNGNEYLQENGTLIGTAEDLSEQMDILLSTLATRNIDLNTVWLWKSILENVLQKAGTFTTSMALKTTIAWKTYKSLLSANTPNFTSNHNSTSPAHEPICMARKPLAEKTVAENVLKYGTGGINIDESRVEYTSEKDKREGQSSRPNSTSKGMEFYAEGEDNNFNRSDRSDITGRFPANLLHDNSEEVRECFPETKSGSGNKNKNPKELFGATMKSGDDKIWEGDSGNSSRFFKSINISGVGEIEDTTVGEDYRASQKAGTPQRLEATDGSSPSLPTNFKSIIYQAKASKSERNKGCEELELKKNTWGEDSDGKVNRDFIERQPRQNNHPTVKPIALMEYLIKMVTPKGGTVLDPFAGSGSTLVAAKQNGYQYIGIEMTEEYIPIIEARLK